MIEAFKSLSCDDQAAIVEFLLSLRLPIDCRYQPCFDTPPTAVPRRCRNRGPPAHQVADPKGLEVSSSSQFRCVSPPCKGGVRGGGPGGTRAWYAVPGRLDLRGHPPKGRVRRFGRRCWLCPVHPP